MAEGMPARMELIHPEGRTVLDSPAHVHITDERIDVVQERGAPLLISVLERFSEVPSCVCHSLDLGLQVVWLPWVRSMAHRRAWSSRWMSWASVLATKSVNHSLLISNHRRSMGFRSGE